MKQKSNVALDLRNNVKHPKIEEVKLSGWQQNIVDAIETHDESRDSEQYQGLSDYSVNRSLGVVVAYPRQSGHTFLANYIAAKYPSVLIYRKMEDFKHMTARFQLHAGTDTLSMFEIYYALHKPDLMQPTPEFMELSKRFDGKRVIILDNGMSAPEDVKNFLYQVAQGIVIILGH